MLFSLLVTKIHFRLPPSSAFSARVAWRVVPDPAKKSKILASGFDRLARDRTSLIKGLGLGFSNLLGLSNNSAISIVPVWLKEISSHIVEYVSPSFTSFKKRFNFGLPLPSLPKYISLLLSRASIL